LVISGWSLKKFQVCLADFLGGHRQIILRITFSVSLQLLGFAQYLDNPR
jgi:hypothetical protein